MTAGLRYYHRSLCLLMVIVGTNSWLLGASDHSQEQPKGNVKTSAHAIEQLLLDRQVEDDEVSRAIFQSDKSAVPALVTGLQRGESVTRAARGLAYVGGPDERKILLRAIKTEKDSSKRSELSSLLAGSLVEPTSKEEWDFLEKCFRGYKEKINEEAFVPFSAALALGTNGSQFALQLLERAAAIGGPSNKENDSAKVVADAIRWIKHHPIDKRTPPETGSDTADITKIVLQNAFYSDQTVSQSSIQGIVFNEDRRRALVTVDVNQGSKDAHGYDIVLQKNAGTWRIVGIWFTWAA